ncbi:hypothetical protein BDV38DRAFT_6753 [Aspergillus pseudotamarii]|uniref:Uncharacterized protein n=1 Tax=Aspergillus pseudotamarii TaxID=132259 RepID=A0A5N6TCJ3_ASPPS|nr:uncharacterized protein BDV38DRAFT_6753 [Aspergillus pseudotamarii]KAE8144043.1 hypothetical protein BDV38DRAFT_6753 [Aspergillus pseudotamarii]
MTPEQSLYRSLNKWLLQAMRNRNWLEKCHERRSIGDRNSLLDQLVYDQNFDSSEKRILESQLAGLFAQLLAVADHLSTMHYHSDAVLGGSTQDSIYCLEAHLGGVVRPQVRTSLGWVCPEAKEGLAGWRSDEVLVRK